MWRLVTTQLFLVLALALCIFPNPSLSKPKRKAKQELSEDSIGCKTCKRIVLSFDRAVFPKLEKAKGKLNSPSYVGILEQVMQEEVEMICTFDSIHYSRTLKNECEAIIDEHGDELVQALLQHAKSEDRKFNVGNFIVSMCHKAAKRCPKSVVSYESEIAARKEQLLTEKKPPEQEQGVFRKLVAEAWEEEVLDPSKDVMTFLYSTKGDTAWQLIMDAMQEAAETLKGCTTIKFGHLDLTSNDLPPPHGDYVEGDGIALWRGDSKEPTWGKLQKQNPVWIVQDVRKERLTTYDILNFVIKSLDSEESFNCVRTVSNQQSKESLSKLMEKKGVDDEL